MYLKARPREQTKKTNRGRIGGQNARRINRPRWCSQLGEKRRAERRNKGAGQTGETDRGHRGLKKQEAGGRNYKSTSDQSLGL